MKVVRIRSIIGKSVVRIASAMPWVLVNGYRHNGSMIMDTGYPHDGRADNAAYRHDRRADNAAYRYPNVIQMLKMFRN